jgi:CheY-like chemotaxis protein
MWLLVEDDNDIRTIVSMMMTFWGESPLSFPDGNAAWAWLDSVENGTFSGTLPELALMDIKMPGYFGDKIAARIRTVANLKEIPIVLMTAFALTEAEIQEMRQKAGIDHLINKPLPDMDVLRSLLYKVRDDRKMAVDKRATQESASLLVAKHTPPVAPANSDAIVVAAIMPTLPIAAVIPTVPTKPPTPVEPTPPPAEQGRPSFAEGNVLAGDSQPKEPKS